MESIIDLKEPIENRKENITTWGEMDSSYQLLVREVTSTRLYVACQCKLPVMIKDRVIY
jgi:hypothetical protein